MPLITRLPAPELRTGRPKAEGPKHDALHPTEENGYRRCNCMCSRCWLRFPVTNAKHSGGGRCICADCPCGSRERASTPMNPERSRYR